MASKIMGIEMSAKNIVIAIVFMVVTYLAIRIVGMFAVLLTTGFFGFLVSAVVGFLLFVAYKRGR